MPIAYSNKTINSQIGYQVDATSVYQIAGGDLNFANGQYLYIRMPTKFKPYTTINSATITFRMIVKNGGTAQSSKNEIYAHASGDSPMLRPGVSEWITNPDRLRTSAVVDWNPAWPANNPDPNYVVDVTSIVQQLVNRSDWVPGGYITFIIRNIDELGSDMGFRANNDFDPSPMLTVNYTDPAVDVKYGFNLIENSAFDPSLSAIDTNNVIPYWGQNNFYNAWVSDPANVGTLARDTSFTRVPGIPTLRFTCGAPAADTGRRTGPITVVGVDPGVPVIFACWLFIPSYIPATPNRVVAGEYWLTMNDVPTRGTWVPFVSTVMGAQSNPSARWCGFGIDNFQAGWQIWMSEPMLLESSFREMPFNGLTPMLKDPGGRELISHRQTASKQRSYRYWLPRTAVKRNNTLLRVPRYIKRSDGILQLAEPIKGGPVVTSLTGTVANLPAGKTVSEL